MRANQDCPGAPSPNAISWGTLCSFMISKFPSTIIRTPPIPGLILGALNYRKKSITIFEAFGTFINKPFEVLDLDKISNVL